MWKWLFVAFVLCGIIALTGLQSTSYYIPEKEVASHLRALSIAHQYYLRDHDGKVPSKEEFRAYISSDKDLAGLRTDPWGQPYDRVANSLPNLSFGFYSKGADGISGSQGNDPDDLATWKLDEDREWYFKQRQRNDILKLLLWLTGPLILVAAWCGLNFRRGYLEAMPSIPTPDQE